MSTAESGGSALSLFRDREFVALSGTAFARSQAYSTILIALALYAKQFGTTGFVEGLFGTAFAAVQLLIVLPLGRRIDTGNSKRYLLAGLAINVAVFVGFMFVENAVHVVLIRMVQGLGASLLWITGATVVGEISPDGSRGRWLGTYNQVAAFSSFAGDLIGGYLLYTYDSRLTYVVLSLITLVATLLVYFNLRNDPGGQKDPEEATSTETLLSLLDRPMVRSLVIFRLGFSVGKMAVIIFLPIFAHVQFDIDLLTVGGILAGGKLTKAILQGVVGDLTDRIGHKHLFVFAGAMLYALGTALIPLAQFAPGTLPTIRAAALGRSLVVAPPVLALFLAYSVLGVADSLRLPASMTLFVEEGERFDSVASSMSLRSISWKIGQLVGPVLVGTIKDTVSATAGFFTAAGFVVVAAVVFLVVYRTSSPSRTTGPAPSD